MNTEHDSRLKQWLNRNKIYFETITSLFLTIMAILLSLFTYLTTVRQAENEELLNQPIIRIDDKQFSYFSSTNTNDSEFLVIENTGIKINSFESEVYTFLKIETENPSSKRAGERMIIYKRISDYYGGSTPHKNVVGELVTYINLGSLNDIHEASLKFKEIYDDDFPMTFITLEKFAMVTFQDFKNKQYKFYYKVDNIYNNKINPEAVESLLKEHDIFNTVSIKHITPEYIKGLILNAIK
jgi:hypothetical protein